MEKKRRKIVKGNVGRILPINVPLTPLVATYCLNETMVTRVVCSCTVDAEVTSPKTWNDSLFWKVNPFLTFLTGTIGQNYFPKYATSNSHNQFYKMKMPFYQLSYLFHHESLAKLKYFQCIHLLLTALHHKKCLKFWLSICPGQPKHVPDNLK